MIDSWRVSGARDSANVGQGGQSVMSEKIEDYGMVSGARDSGEGGPGGWVAEWLCVMWASRNEMIDYGRVSGAGTRAKVGHWAGSS